MPKGSALQQRTNGTEDGAGRRGGVGRRRMETGEGTERKERRKTLSPLARIRAGDHEI